MPNETMNIATNDGDRPGIERVTDIARDQLSILRSSIRPRLLVVGDVILDSYLWGNVERISPEAPIPLLKLARQEQRLGGAGSVASMLAALDVDVTLASVVGDDREGEEVRRLLHSIRLSEDSVLTAPGRPTTFKQRFLGLAHHRHAQQMIRVDREDIRPFPREITDSLLSAIEQALPGTDLILLSDYNKGTCADDFIPRLVSLARASGVRVLADPVLNVDYHRYAGCTCMTPNRLEASYALGRPIRTPEEGRQAARDLLQFGVDCVVVTMDRDGMAWANRKGEEGIHPVRQREVYDITGAGDMALSVIGFGLAAGLPFPKVIDMANAAGGLEVEKLGVVPLSRKDIMEELESAPGLRSPQSKIVARSQLAETLERRRHIGQRIVMTNGCFDLLHPGHISSLQTARRQGDCLLVGLNSDISVRGLKGPERPIIGEQGRASMVAALECVDIVVLFDDLSVASLVEEVAPDVLVKSSEYKEEQIAGRDFVLARGGKVYLTPMEGDYSTSALVRRIRNADQERTDASS